MRHRFAGGRFVLAVLVVALLPWAAGCADGDGGLPIGEPDNTVSAGLSVDETEASATVFGGTVRIELPVSRTPAVGELTGTAQATIEELAGDEVGTGSARFVMADGSASRAVAVNVSGIPAGTSAGDLAKYVVRYRVSAEDALVSGSRSLFVLARRVATVVTGSDKLYADETAYLRVAARSPGSGDPLVGADVDVVLETTDADGATHETPVWTGRTDRFGMASVEFATPPLAGAASLIVRTRHGEDAAESRHSVLVQRSHRILITTDKPLYQPGQTMHLRALALRLPSAAPSADLPVTIEISDAKGNKVFRQDADTDRFGVASAQFTLARMVNMGRYTIRAGIEDAIQERTVTVDRYALPKFAIDFEADKAFYLPGERLTGQIDARYFFGQPVAGGEVTVTASQFDVDWTQFAELHGTTDAEGHYDFTVDLPTYFVGLPLEGGGSFAKLDIAVVDTAGQSFQVERAITVANGAVQLVLIPERPTLAPGVANQMFLLTADPTGTPISTQCDVSTDWGTTSFPVETDERGFAVFEVTPGTGSTSFYVTADDGRGRTVTQYFYFSTTGSGTETVLLRTDRSIYRVGDTATITIYSPRANDRVYLDAVRQGQTVLTKIVEVESGWSTQYLDIDENLAGSLTLSVYYIADSGDIIRDQRVLYVEGADALDLELAVDRPSYRPAETARLDLTVRRADNGDPVEASVGLMVVDEAVFALSEMKPGLERIFFELEEDIMQSQYEIHGFDSGSVFGEGEPDPDDAEMQESAKVLFAAAGGRTIYGIDYSSEYGLLSTVLGHEQAAVNADAQRIAEALGNYQTAHSDWSEAGARRWLDRVSGGWYDPWGQRYRAEWQWYEIIVRSAGCDEVWGTDDDAIGYGWTNGGDDWGFEEDGDPRGERPGAAADGGAGEAGTPPPSTPGGAGPEVRIRQWFPETLYVNPSILTDTDGRATVEIPLADSITSWRMTGLASSLTGQIGSTLGNITVFQEFFVDLSLPATLTLGDEITVPVVVYNYLDAEQTVDIEVTADDWFTALSPLRQSLTLGPREVSSVPLTIRAEQVGWHDLEAVGRAGDLGDGLRRRIEVMPSGRQFDEAKSDMIEATPAGTSVTFEFHPPADAVEGANELLVKLYPGVFAQAIEGLDSILKMPSGCFEQTSSATYPNVMALAYMQETGTTTPEVDMKAREYINQGYQRLLTYEVTGGGFEWFGQPPAHKILTAYGLMEFSDMAKVHPVDPAVLTRTAEWLAAQQNSDGSWTPDAGGIAEGAINNYQNSQFRTTAYLLWALLESGYSGTAVTRAVAYLHGHVSEAADAYSRAIAAQALVTNDPADPAGVDLLDQLAEEVHLTSGAAYWGEEGGDGGVTYSRGSAHILETTALVVDVFFRARAHLDLASQGLTYLVRSKDSFGNWETTQATVYALRAMLRSMDSAGDAANCTIDVRHNGDLVQTLTVTPEDYDLFRQIDLKDRIVPGAANIVEITMTGSGTLMYQTVGTYWMPWDEVPPETTGPLSIDVAYDRTSLAVDDTVTATVTLTNNTAGDLMMVIVDLGIPPGFDVDTEDLDALVEAGTFRRYEMTGRQIIVYFDQISMGPPIVFEYDLVARNPMRGEAPPSDAYLYYDPRSRSVARPFRIQVEE